MSNELRINEVIQYPGPKRTAPGLIVSFFALEFADNLVVLEL
jgi:hypothetical protein